MNKDQQVDNINQPNQITLSDTLLQMIYGSLVTQIIYVAAKLGLPDLLKDGAKSYEELALSTNVEAEALYRILRTLASIGIFSEDENRYFQLTPLAQYLRSDVPESLRAIAIMFGGEDWHWQPWGKILHSVETGKSAFEYVTGAPVFQYLSENQEAASIFNAAMTSFSAYETKAIIDAYDFSSIQTLVDVGGGHGSLLASILEANPTLKGIVYDLPNVVAGAKERIEASALNKRFQILSGDFFASVPYGGDAHILKHIIHDWNDERCVTILKNCYQALPKNGKILLVECVISGINEPFPGKLIDIEMLVMSPGGKERTASEFRELFAAAGFHLTNIIPTQSPVSVIEGIKI